MLGVGFYKIKRFSSPGFLVSSVIQRSRRQEEGGEAPNISLVLLVIPGSTVPAEHIQKLRYSGHRNPASDLFQLTGGSHQTQQLQNWFPFLKSLYCTLQGSSSALLNSVHPDFDPISSFLDGY